MAEVLSQSQIDALLKGMRSGDNKKEEEKPAVEEKKYRKYDFYSPKKITKDKIKLLKGIYDNYSRIASSRLNGMLRVNCELSVLTVEEQRFFEFSNMLSENDIFITQKLKLPNKSSQPPILVHIDQAPILSMMDRLLGGDGSDLKGIDSNYSYTDIEIELYRKIMGYFLDFTLEAWANYIHVETENVYLEENPSLFQEISLDETIAIIMLKVVTGTTEGKITVCLSRTLLIEMFNIIDSRKHAVDVAGLDTAATRSVIMSKIKNSALTVQADMGRVAVSVKDIHDLQVGDIIDLERPKDSEIYLRIGGESWLQGRLGTYKKNAAVLVSGRPDAEREPDRNIEEKMEEPVPAE